MPESPPTDPFVELTMMLATSAMQQLGKLVNPMTGKAEVNLAAAQVTIDMLEALKVRTKGNLDRNEERLLADTLAMLQMNYVETAAASPSSASNAAATQTEDKASEAVGDAPRPEDPPREKKFHKTYG